MIYNNTYRHTAHWSTFYDILDGSSNYIDICATHIAELLTVLKQYAVFVLERCLIEWRDENLEKKCTEGVLINDNNPYDKKMWTPLLTELDTVKGKEITLFGKSMLYIDGKPTWLRNVLYFEIALTPTKVAAAIFISIDLQNDDWFPYYFIKQAKRNPDYLKNGPRLEQALTQFFCKKYSYDIDFNVADTGIAGEQKGFQLENTITEGYLSIYDKSGRFADIVELDSIE